MRYELSTYESLTFDPDGKFRMREYVTEVWDGETGDTLREFRSIYSSRETRRNALAWVRKKRVKAGCPLSTPEKA